MKSPLDSILKSPLIICFNNINILLKNDEYDTPSGEFLKI